MGLIRKYLYNVWISFDQFVSTLFLGDPDETISSRLGKLEQANGGKIPWRYGPLRLLELVLNWIETDHCRKSIEADEGKDEVA